MIRATTPTFTLTVKDEHLDLGQAESVYVTITQGQTSITKSGEDVSVDQNVCSCWLTQAEALRFQKGAAEVQVNWTYTDTVDGTTRRAATRPKAFEVEKQLLPRVIT